MALTIYVEDELHTRLRSFSDDAQNSFLNLCRRCSAAGSKVMDVIDPYTDTMLNFIQLDRLILELEEVLHGNLSAGEREVTAEVRRAAVEAREISGYLFIQGD
jgi:Fe-S-cluster formation regulator IscX/YfhJ